MTDRPVHTRQALVEQISTTETRLSELRAARDEQIIEAYHQGASKYRLAKDWALSENTITRIVTGRRPGQRHQAADRKS